MKVQQNKVVSFHYTLTGQEGEQIESSREREPMHYLHGAGTLLKGLESALEGRSTGDTLQITLEPSEAYGENTGPNIQRISAKHVRHPRKLRPGQVLNLQTHQGPVQVTVVKVGRFNIDVDATHPLAGQALTWDLEVMAVRDATEEEIAHGHVHGPGGVEH